MTTYTAVLLTDTAVPAWHDAHREMPVVFAASAVSAAGGLGLVGAGVHESGPAARLGAAGAAVELAASTLMERRLPDVVGEKYRTGRAGKWMRAAKALTAAGAVGALAWPRNRGVAAVSGLALLGGSLATRFGIFHAGQASAADPRDVVEPQRARLEARRDGATPAITGLEA
jgi:formate-dependent nitrite reductase membrane component NrfD